VRRFCVRDQTFCVATEQFVFATKHSTDPMNLVSRLATANVVGSLRSCFCFAYFFRYLSGGERAVASGYTTMTYTLGEAVAASSHGKRSALRPLKSGTISDTRNAHGGEPVDLRRLLPVASSAQMERKLAWSSQIKTLLFSREAHALIEEALDAIPNGSAITFSADSLEVLVASGGALLADAKTTATIIEALANRCGCSFALHGDTATFTKDIINSAASAEVSIPRSVIQTEKEDKMFGKSKRNSYEEIKVLPPVQQLQGLTPTHLAASDSAAESSIGPGMMVVGKISSEGTVNVYGRVEGELHASIVWIFDGARVEGTIAAQELTIGGRFKGTIKANCVTLISSAVVEGEILHRHLKIEGNAWFAGVSRPEQASVSELTDPQSCIEPRPAFVEKGLTADAL
jgi:cytoskeletal protein CcmA (bactofilin family)